VVVEGLYVRRRDFVLPPQTPQHDRQVTEARGV